MTPVDTPPLTTVLVCTRNRGASIALPLRSILSNPRQDFELIVVDQSTNDETERATQPFRRDERLRYIRTPTVGVSIARNIGVSQARASVVAMTDDDCEVDRDWIEKIASVFTRLPRVAVVYCNVVPSMAYSAVGFVPSYVATESRIMIRMRDWCAPHGIGAGMAVRRDFMEQIGGLDESMGPGSRFSSFEDSDLALRALAMGYHVYHTHETAVHHFGFRTWEEGRALSRRDCFGIGAGYAKLLKCGQWRVGLPWAYELGTLLFVPAVSSLLRGKKPPVLTRGLSLMRGFWQGLRTPVDRARLLFRLK